MTLPPHFAVSGSTAFERGQNFGEAARDYVRLSREIYEETFDHYTGRAWHQVVDHARQFRTTIENFDKATIQEMDGIAAAANLPADDVLTLNVRTEVMFGLAAKTPPCECTSFFAGPEATRDGHTLLGQNWDWRVPCEESLVTMEVDQGPNRPSIITFVEAGILAKTGFNSAGIGLATNTLLSGDDRGAPDVPYHVLLRAILNCSSFDAAVAVLQNTRRAASGNFLIAEASGRAIDIETGPGGIDSLNVLEPVDGVLGHSNNFACATGLKDLGAEKWPDAPIRHDVINAALSDSAGTITVDTLVTALRDHENHPDAVCRHPNPADHLVEQSATGASVIYDLDDLTAYVTAGRPCESKHERVTPAFSHHLIKGTR